MTGSFLALLTLGAVLASAAMTCLWVVQVRTRDASHVEIAVAVEPALQTLCKFAQFHRSDDCNAFPPPPRLRRGWPDVGSSEHA